MLTQVLADEITKWLDNVPEKYKLTADNDDLLPQPPPSPPPMTPLPPSPREPTQQDLEKIKLIAQRCDLVFSAYHSIMRLFTPKILASPESAGSGTSNGAAHGLKMDMGMNSQQFATLRAVIPAMQVIGAADMLMTYAPHAPRATFHMFAFPQRLFEAAVILAYVAIQQPLYTSPEIIGAVRTSLRILKTILPRGGDGDGDEQTEVEWTLEMLLRRAEGMKRRSGVGGGIGGMGGISGMGGVMAGAKRKLEEMEQGSAQSYGRVFRFPFAGTGVINEDVTYGEFERNVDMNVGVGVGTGTGVNVALGPGSGTGSIVGTGTGNVMTMGSSTPVYVGYNKPVTVAPSVVSGGSTSRHGSEGTGTGTGTRARGSKSPSVATHKPRTGGSIMVRSRMRNNSVATGSAGSGAGAGGGTSKEAAGAGGAGGAGGNSSGGGGGGNAETSLSVNTTTNVHTHGGSGPGGTQQGSVPPPSFRPPLGMQETHHHGQHQHPQQQQTQAQQQQSHVHHPFVQGPLGPGPGPASRFVINISGNSNNDDDGANSGTNSGIPMSPLSPGYGTGGDVPMRSYAETGFPGLGFGGPTNPMGPGPGPEGTGQGQGAGGQPYGFPVHPGAAGQYTHISENYDMVNGGPSLGEPCFFFSLSLEERKSDFFIM